MIVNFIAKFPIMWPTQYFICKFTWIKLHYFFYESSQAIEDEWMNELILLTACISARFSVHSNKLRRTLYRSWSPRLEVAFTTPHANISSNNTEIPKKGNQGTQIAFNNWHQLLKMAKQIGKDWDSCLPFVLFAYRSSICLYFCCQVWHSI